MKKEMRRVLCMICVMVLLASMTACGTSRRPDSGRSRRVLLEENTTEPAATEASSRHNRVTDSNRGPMNSMEMADYLDERVVKIETNYAIGSGFFIDEKGTIATNFHVIDGATNIFAVMEDGSEYSVKNVIDFIPEYDIALIRANTSGNKYLKFGKSYEKGENIFVYGCPRGFDFTLTTGIVSGLDRQMGSLECFQVDAAVNPGNSGGPVVNAYGEVIGIATLVSTIAENTNFAIPISTIDKLDRNASMTINEFIEWTNKEARRSYKDANGEDTHVHTYTTVTGRECARSTDDMERFNNGYIAGSAYYAYDFRVDEYDQYCSYLRQMGYVLSGRRTERGLEMDVYTNSLDGYSIQMVELTGSNQLLISCPYYPN